MKKILVAAFILSSLSAYSQTARGPGLKDAPPTAGPVTNGGNNMKDTGIPGPKRVLKPLQKQEEVHEQGPAGEYAKKAAKNGQLDVSKKEMQKKERGL